MRIAFTDRELDIMLVLWERGASTVSEVRDALPDELARNTVLTMLKILCEKGYVLRDESERTHRYAAAVEREAARDSAATRLTRRLFGNSPALLMTQLIQRPGLTEDELRDLRALIDRELDGEDR
jgi:BlaI family transcriptional regulator, penicillinase repressor